MSRRREPKRILDGLGEPIFSVLPERVLANLRSSTSENALLWNLFYPISRGGVDLRTLLDLPVLWGTQSLPETRPDCLHPYFWGYSVDGHRLAGLDESLEVIDGPGLQTEVDLYLVGQHNLVAAEVKRGARPGRCQRFQASRCPEVHPADSVDPVCRYWHQAEAMFTNLLDFGDRPQEGQLAPPPCCHHYQLGRTLLVGRHLAESLGLQFHLWLVLPAGRWRANRRIWLDFTERIRDSRMWRRSRAIAWREIQKLPVN